MFPKAKKSFGQNFLQDTSVIRKIIEAADISVGETVLEIGPGTGVLTEALIEAGAHVVAVEADRDLVELLREKFGEKIVLVQGNALTVSLDMPDGGYKLVANVPYNITSRIFRTFLSGSPRPSRMVLMVQREVADRILAKPPKMSLLSVVCQLQTEVKKVTNVPRGAFRPIPRVDSAVIQLDRKKEVDEVLIERAIHLAKAGFASKRKQLRNTLSAADVCSSEEVEVFLQERGLDPQARAEVLRPEDWMWLATKISE